MFKIDPMSNFKKDKWKNFPMIKQETISFFPF